MKCFKKSIFVSAIIFFFTVFFWTAVFAADDEIRIGEPLPIVKTKNMQS